MSGRDRGSAGIWVLVGALLVLSLALVVTQRTEAVLARHRAEAAADLAALAGAGQIGLTEQTTICVRARELAGANGATLTGCQVQLAADGRSGSVTVTVHVDIRLAFLGKQRVTGRARARRLPG